MLSIFLISIFAVLSGAIHPGNRVSVSNPCQFQAVGDGICICDPTYCDTLDTPDPSSGGYTLVTSSQAGKRFDVTIGDFKELSTKSHDSTNSLEIVQKIKHQDMTGFGGSLSDSSSLLISLMDEALRKYFYQSVYSPTLGAAHTITRVPIGATDLSDKAWGYNELPEYDTELTNMTQLDPHDMRRISQIMEARQVVPTLEEDMRYMFCAWSALPWMKNNKAWSGAFSYVLPEYYGSWAHLLTKVLLLWFQAGVDAWGISTGNEPTNTIAANFPSNGWDPIDQIEWVNKHLRPTLNQNQLKNVKILGIDDQRYSLAGFTNGYQESFSDPSIPNIDIFAIHWYGDTVANIKILDEVRTVYKKPMLLTEGCLGTALDLNDQLRGPKLGSWYRCQSYVHDLIENFQHGISGYVDWNYVLNTTGGPSYTGATLDAPMILVPENQTLIKQPAYYGLAHFSRYLQKDCVRIESVLNVDSASNVEAISFICAKKQIVVILHNMSPQDQIITVKDEQLGSQTQITLDANSVNTLLYASKSQIN